MVLALSTGLFSQNTVIDYNQYYRFPLSVGIEYQNLSPLSDYASSYSIFDLSGNIRVPIPSRPVFQPSFRLGMIQFDNQDLSEPVKWDHTHWYGQIGVSYTHRFDKKFEVSAEIMAGGSQAVFPDLIPSEGNVGMYNLLFETGMRIGLDPSYSMSIDIHPSLKYLKSLGYITDYDGFILGIGFSASYRFGEDPDAPSAIIRSLKFSEPHITDLFAAMQSYYVENALGSVTITNTEEHDLEDLEISFYQAGFMDTPTPIANFPLLSSGESTKVPILASFNRKIFSVEGVTPLTGEIIACYSSHGKPAEQRYSIPYDLHDKKSLIWDDDRKVAAFITPADSALRNYASFIRQSCRDSTIPAYSEPMQVAIQVYHALGEIGCLYQPDPTSPFTQVQENLMVIDSISLPRDTLKNITGDCDDLTVLYNSLLETVGVHTAFITIPGHIFAAFNTGIAARDFRKIHPNRDLTISIDGEIWIPVEITMIGKTGFLEAWRTGIEEWNQYAGETSLRTFHKTGESQEIYRPVGLTETDLGLQYGRGENINRDFNKDMNTIMSLILDEYITDAEDGGRKQDYNRLGIIYAQFKKYDKAEAAFAKAVRMDPEYTGAKINLANIYFLREEFADAADRYKDIFRSLEASGRAESSIAFKVLINLARTLYVMEDFNAADTWFSKAKSINPEQTERYAYLRSRDDTGGRAGMEQSTEEAVIFIEEE